MIRGDTKVSNFVYSMSECKPKNSVENPKKESREQTSMRGFFHKFTISVVERWKQNYPNCFSSINPVTKHTHTHNTLSLQLSFQDTVSARLWPSLSLSPHKKHERIRYLQPKKKGFPPYSRTHNVRWSCIEWVPAPRRRMKGQLPLLSWVAESKTSSTELEGTKIAEAKKKISAVDSD